jgi:hypothetical protein
LVNDWFPAQNLVVDQSVNTGAGPPEIKKFDAFLNAVLFVRPPTAGSLVCLRQTALPPPSARARAQGGGSHLEQAENTELLKREDFCDVSRSAERCVQDVQERRRDALTTQKDRA